jgi:NAD-dependent SIR2 family protein deacetylase
MRYDYYCSECQEKWEENQFLNDRDLPLALPCPKCKKPNCVKRGFFTATRMSYAGSKSNLARAGSGWNDLLTGIKKASARNTTIETR